MSSTQQLLLGEGAGGSAAPVYVEDVFSTWLYTGNGTTQTITNGIDLSGKGGMVWIKDRTSSGNQLLFDTSRGALNLLKSNSAIAADTTFNTLTAFNSTGFSLGNRTNDTDAVSTNNNYYTSWTFREQPKFFDVVTYTGDGTTPRSIAHNLGSTPGCVMIKMRSSSADWYVYHNGLSTTAGTYIRLNSAGTTNASTAIFPASPVNSTTFKVGDNPDVNGSGQTYVAYLFAHDAGGFGLTGTDNVISCGSYTTDNGAATAFTNLGYEPQWILTKQASETGDWIITDNMRGLLGGPGTLSQNLYPNTAGGEADTGRSFEINQSGFKQNGGGTAGTVTCIYIAIRRGPMKVPTLGTSVFIPITSAEPSGTLLTTGFPVDMQWSRDRINNSNTHVIDKLRGSSSNATEGGQLIDTNLTSAETVNASLAKFWGNTNYQIPSGYGSTTENAIYWNFRRAPSFFDEVCYIGTGANRTVTHRLGVVPELMIVKRRNVSGAWDTYSASLAATQYIVLNTTAAVATGTTRWNSTRPTSSVFSLGTGATVNASGSSYVAYLFATCAGVSKVGTYTGNGTTQTIDCGFTGGARFVLIKRTNAVGDWYVYDTARGMTVMTDPYLFLNETAAEVATLGSVTTVSTGFALNATILASINASGGIYIFLAIA